VELGIVTGLLSGVDARRVLEAGTGEGRLSPGIRSCSQEYVGVDAVVEFLQRIPRLRGTFGSQRLVAANINHLPLADQSFSAVVMVRVFNFFPDPRVALAELNRVLAPGGSAILSIQIRPSLASLTDDVKSFLSNDPSTGTLTFAREDMARVRMTRIPAWQMRRRGVRALLRKSGFAVTAECVSGLEDYLPFRGLPVAVFHALSRKVPRAPGFPTVTYLARKLGESPKFLPMWSETLVCPRCHLVPTSSSGEGVPSPCHSCGFKFTESGGILDARYEVVP
jgi:ubiquinone/menaquinone biosynthesis C-methylase UbiE